MRLIDKHFFRQGKYYKIFNRNNIKLSYACTLNNVIRKYSSEIMKDLAPSSNKTWQLPSKSRLSYG